MKKISLVILISLYLSAQSIEQHSFNKEFDFWVGKWTTEMSNAPKWEIKSGTDEVRFLLKGRLIEEVFSKPSSDNFQRGYLTYIQRKQQWKHTIYDTKWGEYTFWGSKQGDKIILKSDLHHDRKGFRRETFYNITDKSFDYLWESSTDGKSYTAAWKVSYTRVKD